MSSRRRRRRPDSAPVALPRLTVTADGDLFTLVLDGETVDGSPVARADLGRSIAAAADARGVPIRVDVHDLDGRIHTDIIAPPPPGSDPGRTRRDQRGPAIHHRGFLPGEQVVIAVIDRVEAANANGVITLSITRELVGDRELILFGRISGTIHLADAP